MKDTDAQGEERGLHTLMISEAVNAILKVLFDLFVGEGFFKELVGT